MTTTFLVRMDMGDEGEIVWWADTNAITGFSAAAGSLAELRELIDEAVALYLAPDAKVELDLVAPDKGVESEVEAQEHRRHGSGRLRGPAREGGRVNTADVLPLAAALALGACLLWCLRPRRHR